MGGSKKTTVGYWYKALFHHGLGKGPLDALLEVRGGDRTAWKGAQTSSGTITINAPMLWGGEKDQGGIVGDMDVMLGEATQQPNSYLLANLGPQIPAWRGIASVVFKGGKYGAMNPYPQPASYKIRRIIAGWDGTCWNSSKAEIVMQDIREPVTGGSGWVDRDTGLFYVGAYKAVSGFYSTFNGWFNGYIGGLRATVGVARYAQKSYSVPTALFGDALSDPYWGNVLFQLRMQGSNGSTSFVDDKGHVVTAYGGAQISTAQSPFGGSSGYFNGSDSYLTVNVGAAEMLGNSWTIDGWIRVGDYDSTPNTYGNTIFSYGVPETPGYESTLGVFGNNLYFGQQELPHTNSALAQQNILPFAQIGQWAFVSICFDGARHWLHVNGQLVTSFSSLKGMNPAHMLYYSRTNSDMGGEDVANIDAASLSAAADTLFSEGFGLCTTRNPSSESVEEFEGRIAKVIGGAFCRDPVDGKWYLDLARGDYVLSSLPILTDDDVIEFNETPATLDSAINSVSVKYFDPELRETITTPPVQARGLIAAFGTNHQTFDYPEIPTADLALRVAQRELRATATPLRAFELVTTRVTHSWRVNTYFRLQLPKRGIADMVCIVGQKQSGTLRSGAIRIGAVQDVYSMPESVFVSAEAGVDTAAPENPMAILRQLAIELPYSEVVQLLSRADLSVLPTDAGFLAAVADDPQRSIDYTMMVDDGSGYRQAAVASWCPTATVVEAGSYTNTAFTLAGFVRLDQVEVWSAAVWGNEIVRVDALNPSTGAVTFGRGCSDTVPQTHAAGERIWFVTGDSAIDSVEYAGGETVAVKLLTNSGSQQLPISAATEMSVAFSQRQIRPYPPGNVKINNSAYPSAIIGTYSISWHHRDRLAQADQLIDTTVASIGPEGGTTYTVRLYGQDDTLLRTEVGLEGASYTWSSEGADSGLGASGQQNVDTIFDSTDIYWANVVSLLHANGYEGQATISDEKGVSWARSGSSILSSSQAKTSSTSLLIPDINSDFNAASGLLLTTDIFTIEGFFYLLGAPFYTAYQAHPLISASINAPAGEFQIFVNASYKLSVDLRAGASGDGSLTGTTTISLNRWYHFAATWDGTTWRIFLDGNLEASAAKSFGWKNTGAPIRLGRSTPYTSSNWSAMNGLLDEVRITKGVARYTANFAPPTGIDEYWDNVVALLRFNGPDGSTTFLDEKGHTFTGAGNAQIDTAISKFGGGAAIFDGTGDWISTGASSDFDFGTGDFTLELWVYPTATGRIIIASNSASWSAGAVGIGMNASNVPSLFAHSAGGTICSGPAVTASAWNHVALVRSGNSFKIYTNGVPGTAGTFTGSCNFNDNAGTRIGMNWDGDPYMWSGSMDDLRITKGVARYTAAFAPPTSQFPNSAGGWRLNGRIRAEIESVRDGFVSTQKHNISVDRAGYGYQYGNYYGGI